MNKLINPKNPYNYKIFKKNNKIGFYYFTNKDGIRYDVRVSQYYDEIDGIDSKILDVEFAANNEWKQSNITDKFNVLSTIGSILNDYYSDNQDVDYITYVLDRNDNPEKRNKIYQYIVKSIGLKISEIKRIGSNFYLKINKNNYLVEMIIKEEIKKILGKGEGGTAYLTDDNKVYKVTQSVVEYLIAKKLLNKETKSLFKVYDLGKTDDGNYFIFREYFKDIPNSIKEFLKTRKSENLILNYYNNNDLNIKKYLGQNFLDFLNNLKEELPLIKLNYTKLDLESLHKNIGMDKNGNYRLFDF